jgi:hypothetical protein
MSSDVKIPNLSALSPTITTPTIVTSATVPLVIGGTAASSSLTLKSTSGVGTTDSIIMKVGNNGAVTAMTVTSDGRIYGTALHNNAGAVTGTTNQYIASGTYTGTVSAFYNISGVSQLTVLRWMRVGNVVTVGGRIVPDPVAAGQTIFELSLPIASTLDGTKLSGIGAFAAGAGVQKEVAIYGTTTTNTATFEFDAPSGTANYCIFTFVYEVL